MREDFSQVANHPPANAEDSRDAGSIPGSGRPPGVGNDKLLQCSFLENSMDGGAWWATAHGVTKESDTTEYAHTESEVTYASSRH